MRADESARFVWRSEENGKRFRHAKLCQGKKCWEVGSETTFVIKSYPNLEHEMAKSFGNTTIVLSFGVPEQKACCFA